MAPFTYLGHVIQQRHIVLQTVQKQVNLLANLTDYQPLCFNINCLHSTLKLAIHDIDTLFDIVKGNLAQGLLSKPKTALDNINLALSNAQLSRVDLSSPKFLITFLNQHMGLGK